MPDPEFDLWNDQRSKGECRDLLTDALSALLRKIEAERNVDWLEYTA